MTTRIRLRRMGSNKRPFYRVVVADQRSPRDGRFIEIIGRYHPLNDPSVIEIDEDRALHWLMVGAQPSNQVRNLMSKIGIWDRFVASQMSGARGLLAGSRSGSHRHGGTCVRGIDRARRGAADGYRRGGRAGDARGLT